MEVQRMDERGSTGVSRSAGMVKKMFATVVMWNRPNVTVGLLVWEGQETYWNR